MRQLPLGFRSRALTADQRDMLWDPSLVATPHPERTGRMFLTRQAREARRIGSPRNSRQESKLSRYNRTFETYPGSSQGTYVRTAQVKGPLVGLE